MVEEILSVKNSLPEKITKSFIAKFITWFSSKVYIVSFIVILLASIVFLYIYKLKSKNKKDTITNNKIANACIFFIICGLLSSLFVLLVDFLIVKSPEFFEKEDFLNSISKVTGIIVITFCLSVFTLYLWKLPKVLFIILGVIIILALLFFILHKLNTTLAVAALGGCIAYAWVQGITYESIKSKIDEFYNECSKSLHYLYNMKLYIQKIAFFSSFIFFLPVVTVFHKVGTNSVHAVEMWLFFILIQLAYKIYINYNVFMMVNHEKYEKDIRKSIVQSIYHAAHTTVTHEIVALYNLFVNILDYIGVSDMFCIEPIVSNNYDTLIDFLGRTDETIQTISKIQENRFLSALKLNRGLILVPLHLSLFMIRYFPYSFETICSFSSTGPVSIPFSFIKNLSDSVSMESSICFISYCVLVLVLVILEYAFICSEFNQYSYSINEDSDSKSSFRTKTHKINLGRKRSAPKEVGKK